MLSQPRLALTQLRTNIQGNHTHGDTLSLLILRSSPQPGFFAFSVYSLFSTPKIHF